ncbi:MAG TPA: trypsin-like peptidase domain-containing protein [Verrucomicrobiae bacterium]|nr:trypsin-like peptidase domain-containing protein [Verrucomicrobiae bacterium]
MGSRWKVIPIVSVLLFGLLARPAISSEDQLRTVRIEIRIALVMQDLLLRPVPRKAVVVQSSPPGASPEVRLVTNLEGRVEAQLSPGSYRVVVSEPVSFEGRMYSWDVPLAIDGKATEILLELSNDNASPVSAPTEPSAPLTTEGQVFNSSRDGVLTVESETGHGSGFVVDPMGLVVTNAHVVEQSREMIAAFDPAHRFLADVMVVDSAHDIAVLRYNPGAFPEAVTLRYALKDAQPVRVGDPVIAIGSPLNQDKIITKGIVSKVDEGVILSDVNINHGNSGGPLLNGSGVVIGITTFKDLDPTGGGVSGIVRIEVAEPLIQKAREMAQSKTPPSADPLPAVPAGEFPLADLKKQLTDHVVDPNDYSARRSTFDVQVMTPALKYYLETKEEVERVQNRAKKQKHAEAVADNPDADPYTNLRTWRSSLGEFRPVVEVYMLPRLKATGGSIFGAMMVGDSSVLHYRYKSDFDKAELLVDGKSVTPIRKNRFTRSAKFASANGFANDEAFAGVYTFGIEFLKDVKETSHVSVVIHDGLKPEKPIQIDLDPETIWKIRNDFSPVLGPPAYAEPQPGSVSGGATG